MYWHLSRLFSLRALKTYIYLQPSSTQEAMFVSMLRLWWLYSSAIYRFKLKRVSKTHGVLYMICRANWEPYQNLHCSTCSHERWLQNRTKICMAPSVYMKDEFRTVPKFAWLRLFTWKTNSEPYQNFHVSVCLHERWIQDRTKIYTVPSVYMKD